MIVGFIGFGEAASSIALGLRGEGTVSYTHLDVYKRQTPYSAILSALIFNAVIIPSLIPIAMRGVKYKPMRSEKMLLKNMGIYGVGGVIVPFIGIKLIDMRCV